MQNKLFLKAADICELLEVKQTSAYEIIGNLNKELEEQGYLTLRGKVPTKYFVKRFYGVEDTCEIPQEEGKEWFHAEEKNVFISGRHCRTLWIISFVCLPGSGKNECRSGKQELLCDSRSGANPLCRGQDLWSGTC